MVKGRCFLTKNFRSFLLPKMKKTYILRSCLIDAVGIENTYWIRSLFWVEIIING